MRKTLTAIVAAAALAVVGAGCYYNHTNPEYAFDGTMNGEHVKFYEGDFKSNSHMSCENATICLEGDLNYLEVTKKDGTVVFFADDDNDFKLEYVEISKGNHTARFNKKSKNPAAKKIVENSQKEFNAYLKKIIEFNAAPSMTAYGIEISPESASETEKIEPATGTSYIRHH